MSAQTLTVAFHGTDLFIIEHNGQPYTPMKPIVEGMGLDWASQFVKLKANEQRWGIVKITIPTLGDLQEAICIPLRKLAGWMAGIHSNKIIKADKEEQERIRAKIVEYQNECDDALWDYWTKGQATRQPAPETPKPQVHPAPAKRPIHIPMTPFELREVKEAVASVVRYFCFHAHGQTAYAAVYGILFEAFHISRIEHLSATDLPVALAYLQRMHTQAHAYYLEGCQKERQLMTQALRLSAGLTLQPPATQEALPLH